jgi:hypothetical protein
MNDRCASEHRTKYGGVKRCCRADGHSLPHRDDDGGEWVNFRDVATEFKEELMLIRLAPKKGE